MEECYIKYNCKKNTPETCSLALEGFCPRLFRQDKLFDYAKLTDKQRIRKNLVPDGNGVDGALLKKLEEYEQNIETFVEDGINLYLYSSKTGNGKTSSAINLLIAYINNIWYKCSIECQCLFVNVPKYINAMKENITTPNEYYLYIKERINKVPLVVFDDIGSKLATEYEIDALTGIINDRIDNGLSSIYTSNLKPEELTKCLGPRLTSRILGSCGGNNVKEFKGKDKRGIY